MGNVDITDILLVIAKRVSQSLESAKLKLFPNRFQQVLQGAVDLLNAEIKGLDLDIPEFKVGINANEGNYFLSVGIAKLTMKAKDSHDIRSLLRQYLEPRVNTILEVINSELIDAANQQLIAQGKAGLVVIVDNLDRIDNTPRIQNRSQPEYLFVDRGDQLTKLRCHVVYTIPLALCSSNVVGKLENRFGMSPRVLPMVRVRNRDSTTCESGIAALRKLILVRAFPELSETERLLQSTTLFDSLETLNRLCIASGGHLRNLLILLRDCLLENENLPINQSLVDKVLNRSSDNLVRAATTEQWPLLREVHRTKSVHGEAEYQDLLRYLFVFKYQDKGQIWFDLNPALLTAKELIADD